MKQTYNGWKNKETWVVNLYMNGNYGDSVKHYIHFETIISDFLSRHGWEGNEEILDELTGLVEEAVTASLIVLSLLPSGVMNDLLNITLSEVDWRELTTHRVDDLIEANKTKRHYMCGNCGGGFKRHEMKFTEDHDICKDCEGK